MIVSERGPVSDLLPRPRKARRRVCVASPLRDDPCICPDHFDKIISEHVGPMLAVARRILGSDDLAWDAVQDTLLSLWHEPDVPPHLRGWLLRAVTHRSLHLARTRSRRRRHEERASTRRREGSRRDDPSQLLQDSDFWVCLEKALAELCHEQRTVFVLREVEALDYEAIAERLGIPIGTVRSRLNRSRVALREILGRMSEN